MEVYMGYKLVKFNFVPGENEQIDAIIRVPKEPRSIIHGLVVDEHNKPLKDAVVKLYKQKNCDDNKSLEPLTHTFTDDNGNFIFGPLCPDIKYTIKIWVDHVKIKELIVKPHFHDCENDKDRNEEDDEHTRKLEDEDDNDYDDDDEHEDD
jgi:hypothetical protein